MTKSKEIIRRFWTKSKEIILIESTQHPDQQRHDEDDNKERRSKAALHPRKHRRHPGPLRRHHLREGKGLRSVNVWGAILIPNSIYVVLLA